MKKRWPTSTRGLTVEERFWPKVDKVNGPTMPHMKTRCWPWIAGTFPSGYGCFGPFLGRMAVRSHRIAWELTFGSLGKMCALHRCDNIVCCRPSHLFKGTVGDNNTDRNMKGRSNPRRGESHHRAKLTYAQVLEIRSLSGTVAKQSIADMFGVSREHVRDIISGKYRNNE